MAKNEQQQNASARSARTTGGIGGLNQDLNTGMVHDANGDVVVPEVNVPRGTEIVQQDQIGVYRRTVFSDGSVETVQTQPAEPGDPTRIKTPVPLPGEAQDVSGTGQDAAYKPKTAPSSKKS